MAVAELGYKIESQQVKIAEDRLDGMHRASVKADGSSEKLANTQTKLAKALGSTVGRMVALAAAAVSIGKVVSTLAQFEDGMARLGAITRASEADLAKLRDTAKDLGATTEFSATQAADGLTFLGQAGFTAAESMAAIPAVLDLATASGLGLAQAADTASNIMSGFGIAAGEAALVSDVLAAASSRANTNVAQLGSAMSTVAPIAAAMGIDLNTTAAAIGVMSDAGIQGERAGTALRGVLASLAGPTKQARDALSKYGLTAADVDPQVHGLANVFETLRQRGLSTADAMQIFGREAASGALVLIESAKRVGDFADELSEAEGEASRMAETMRGALGGSFKTLQSSVEALILAMGEAGLTAAIQAVVGALTGIVRVFTQAVELTAEYRGQIIAAALAMTTYFLPSIVSTIATMGAAVATTAAWIASLITLRGVLIATGIGAFIVLAGSLINAFLKLIEKTGSFGNALKLLSDVAVEVFGRIEDAFNLVPIAVKSGASSMKSWFLDALRSMLQGFQDLTWSVAEGLNNLFGTNLSGASIGAISDGPLGGAPLDVAIRDALHDSSKASSEMRDMASNLASPLTSLQALNDAMSEASDEADNTSESVESLIETLNGIPSGGSGGGGGGGGGARDEQQTRISALIESLQTEQEIIAQWHAQAQLDLMLASDAELELIGGRNEAKLRLEQEYQERLAGIKKLEQQASLEGVLSGGDAILGAMGAFNKKALKMQAIFAAAAALISTYKGAAKELEKGTFGFATAAAVIARGLGFVAAIKSAGSSGNAGGAGGGAGAGSVPQQAPQAPRQTRAIIQATGGRSRFTIEEINDIISGIQKESKDGVIIEGFTS